MKIAWLINIVMPEVAERLGLWKTSLGGWLIGQMNGLQDTGNELTVISVTKEIEKETWCTINGVDFCVLPEKSNEELYELIKSVLDRINPDVFHIFGTESKAAVVALEASNLENTVVSIQGLVSVCAEHIHDGIPEKYFKSTMIKRLGKQLLNGSIIQDDADRLARNGKRERSIIGKTRYVIGRTTWDKACAYQINSKAHYFKCCEILRSSFYDGKWDVTKCDRHTIFLSQSASPIKGLHQVLKALPLILQQYPDTVVKIAGAPLSSFCKRRNVKQKMVEYLCGYQGYIENLVRENNLYGHIQFLNYLDEEKMKEQYLKANVFVLPSSIENSPNSLGEAMLLGVPCVASCVGGVQDMLVAPQEGFIYPFEEPYMLAYYVCRIFESDELAMQLSEEAKRHAQKTHNQVSNTEALIGVYQWIGEKNNE